MQRGTIGKYEQTVTGGERVRAFVPTPLPRLSALFQADRTAIQQRCGRRAGSALRVYTALTAQPMLSLPAASARTGLAFRTTATAMERLAEQGIAREITGKRRGRLFVHDRYLDILNEGTEPP